MTFDGGVSSQLQMPQRVVGVGGLKCGSTSLWHLLCSHPEVRASPAKEMYYFAKSETSSGFAGHFIAQRTSGVDLVDVAPGYLHHKQSCANIQEFCGQQTKIVMVIRDPVERAISQYRMQRRAGRSSTGMLQEIEQNKAYLSVQDDDMFGTHYVKFSLYSEAIKRYQDAFGQKNVKVVVFDQLFGEHQIEHFSALCRWLGIADNHDPFGAFSARPDQAKLKLTAPGSRSLWLEGFLASIVGNSALRSFVKQFVPGTRMREFANRSVRYLISLNESQQGQRNNVLTLDERATLYSTYFANDVCKVQELTGLNLSHWQEKYCDKVSG